MADQASVQSLTDTMARFTGYIGKHLPTDVEAKLAELRGKETKPLAKAIYLSMAENQDAAHRLDRPSCQDTGVIQPGGCAALAASQVEEVENAEWQEHGMPETLWVIRVKEFGPLIISIDTKGNNLIEQNKAQFNAKKGAIVDRISSQVRYIADHP